MRRTNRDWKTLVAVVSATVFVSSCHCKPESSEPPQANSVTVFPATLEEQKLVAEELKVATVDPGTKDAAIAYYGETLNELDLNPDNLPPNKLVEKMRLRQVMEYLGYPGIDLKDIEDLPSAELMKRFPGDVLSSVFFAPKITDVSVTPISLGWRKLVRFKAKGEAATKGISAGYLLFNRFQTDLDKDPQGDGSPESANTQLILVNSGSTLKYPLYFLVFSNHSASSRLITFLTATFDARAPNIVEKNRYYVPNACAACHGGLISETSNPEVFKPDYPKLKLNYLDTDHWFDRLEDDFDILKKHTCGGAAKPCPVLYDGRNGQPEFEQAFDAIRQLNREIEAQNESVNPNPPHSFQLRAVRKWRELHETDSSHKDVFARALPPANSADSWKADNPIDKELLPLLNRYCYRCHSSLKYSIFDRPAVVRRRDTILKYMNLAIDDPKKMPQDRNIENSPDRQTILKLVQALPTPKP
jgi:hypothetical protein